MTPTTAIAVYFLIWWVTLFAVLPFGMNRQAEAGDIPGADPGAPLAHVMWRKVGWTTLVASIVFVVVAAIYMSGVIKLDWLIEHFGPPKSF
ncbi:MAG TPA: DUF1467 family protein [Gemmatimonadaceae bacterium]|nr:DUF1467 family protein [Gemmatimonadaceae bacterium]